MPPDQVRQQVEKQFLGTVWEDLDIWRYQKYVEHPPLAKIDAKPYMAMRKWATQFYDVRRSAAYENRPRRARRARTHRDRHPGMPGRGRRPDAGLAVLAEEAAARRCPTSSDCCRRPARRG